MWVFTIYPGVLMLCDRVRAVPTDYDRNKVFVRGQSVHNSGGANSSLRQNREEDYSICRRELDNTVLIEGHLK